MPPFCSCCSSSTLSGDDTSGACPNSTCAFWARPGRRPQISREKTQAWTGRYTAIASEAARAPRNCSPVPRLYPAWRMIARASTPWRRGCPRSSRAPSWWRGWRCARTGAKDARIGISSSALRRSASSCSWMPTNGTLCWPTRKASLHRLMHRAPRVRCLAIADPAAARLPERRLAISWALATNRLAGSGVVAKRGEPSGRRWRRFAISGLVTRELGGCSLSLGRDDRRAELRLEALR